jgi:cation diffusion facilitator CzcD-associated flavoprotein CzcO
LHTDKKHSELPFHSYPIDYPRYPSRSQVLDYLESYAKKFQLEIRFRQTVVSTEYRNDRWEVKTQDTQYEASDLVIATGYNCDPILPTWRGQGLFRGTIIHSSQYKDGEPFRGQNVLVVGFGNSGGEIAIDLWEHGAKPGVAVRGAVNVIPRELMGIPILAISLVQDKMPPALADMINAPILGAAIGDLTKYGLRKLPYGPATQIRKDGHIPLIDVGTIRLIKEGHLRVYAGIEEFTENGIVFSDGKQDEFDAVILATGYRPRVNAFLNVELDLCDPDGTPRSSGGATSLPGLYFCGYYISPTGMLREIGIEAKKICSLIAARQIKAKSV